MEEKQRAARFRFPKHAVRYRLCHAAMRQILGQYLGLTADRVALVTESSGKPRLADNSQLCFNLSHSGDLALLAVAGGLEVGVDVEAVRFDLPVEVLAARFFTASERERLLEMDASATRRTFFQWWSRKEAVLKADGVGIAGGLDHLDISGCPPNLVRFPAAEGRWWRVQDLDAAPGYAAALATPPGAWEVRWRESATAP
jgi:4'-phosphopantetheinyl transferase